MSNITVSILGLGRLGASIGLALRRYNADKGARHHFEVVGIDSRGAVEGAAQKMGAVDSTPRSVVDAVQNRDIVVLTLPYSETQAAYRAIGGELRPGAVVLDLSPLKLPSIKWAESHIKADAYMVGVTPILNPKYLFDGLDDVDHAAADLFDGGTLLLMPATNAPKDAVELSADFASVLGASSHFMDAGEHDGVSAATEGLPALLGLAIFRMLEKGGGWNDSQRLTNPAFGRQTHHLDDTHPDDLRDALYNNRQNLVTYIDQLQQTLFELRTVLEAGDRDALESALVDSAQAYQRWLSRRRRDKWEDSPEPIKSNASLMTGMMGGFLAGKLRKATKDEDED